MSGGFLSIQELLISLLGGSLCKLDAMLAVGMVILCKRRAAIHAMAGAVCPTLLHGLVRQLMSSEG